MLLNGGETRQIVATWKFLNYAMFLHFELPRLLAKAMVKNKLVHFGQFGLILWGETYDSAHFFFGK